MAEGRVEEYAEPGVVELTDIHTRMVVALRLLSDLHARFLRSNQDGLMVDRSPEYRAMAEELRELSHNLAGLCDRIGSKINEKVKEDA